MKIKSVLIISSLYKPNVGGVETTVEELADQYLKRGIKVTILTKLFPSNLEPYELIKGVPVYRIPRPKTEAEFIETIKWLKKNNSKLKSDVIHLIQVHRPLPLLALLLSRLWKVPFIANYAGGDVIEVGDDFGKKMWKEANGTVKEALLQANTHISFSKGLISDVKKTIPEIKKVELIYAGLDVSSINKSEIYNPGYPYIVSVRRLEKSKGIDLLIKAFDKLSESYPHLHLIIVGNGSEKKNLESLATDLNSREKIHFTGTLPLKTTFSYLKGSMASICPSRAEAGGIINFAAQAAKTVPIGSNVGGIPEYILHNKTGLIFESEKVDKLAECIEHIISDIDLRQKLIENGWLNVQKYDWSNIANKYVNSYVNAINTKHDYNFNSWSELTQKLWEIINE